MERKERSHNDIGMDHLLRVNLELLAEVKELRNEVEELREVLKPQFNVVRWEDAAQVCGMSVPSFRRKVYRMNSNGGQSGRIRVMRGLGIDRRDFEHWINSQRIEPAIAKYELDVRKLFENSK